MLVGFSKKREKLAAEQTAQDTYGKKEVVPACDPAQAVERDSSAGHDAVEVRVMMQVLPPTVEHCQEADPSAEVFPIGRNLQKSFGSRTEQQVINDSLILQCQWCQLLGQREDEVKIRCRKKLFGSFVKPFLPGAELALRAMSISARVVGDHGMTALVALFEMTAEGRGAARADVAKSFMLLRRDGVPPLRQKLLLMLANDIGYFEPMFAHLRRPSRSGR